MVANKNPGIGRKPICKGGIEHRGKNGGRLYVRESDYVIEILAKSVLLQQPNSGTETSNTNTNAND